MIEREKADHLTAIGAELRELTAKVKAEGRRATDEDRARIRAIQNELRAELTGFQFARDVIVLEDGYDDADLVSAAVAYETTHGIPLVRPEEEAFDAEGVRYPTEAFVQRIKDMKPRSQPNSVTGDPEIAKRQLQRALAVAARKGLKALSGREREGIHELQRELGLPLLDFERAQRTPEQRRANAEKAFAKLQSVPTADRRVVAVEELSDVATLEMVAQHDTFAEVRAAGRERLAELRKRSDLTGALLV